MGSPSAAGKTHSRFAEEVLCEEGTTAEPEKEVGCCPEGGRIDLLRDSPEGRGEQGDRVADLEKVSERACPARPLCTI